LLKGRNHLWGTEYKVASISNHSHRPAGNCWGYGVGQPRTPDQSDPEVWSFVFSCLLVWQVILHCLCFHLADNLPKIVNQKDKRYDIKRVILNLVLEHVCYLCCCTYAIRGLMLMILHTWCESCTMLPHSCQTGYIKYRVYKENWTDLKLLSISKNSH
jgi:hypothetical protein